MRTSVAQRFADERTATQECLGARLKAKQNEHASFVILNLFQDLLACLLIESVEGLDTILKLPGDAEINSA